MSGIFNKEKLMTYFQEFIHKKVLVVGTGAVGSRVGELLFQTGTGHVTFIDLDNYDESNFSKSSGIIRYPEDIDVNKAKAMSNRISVLLEEGAQTNYLCASITDIGPEALAAFDFIMVALDNYAAKVYLNQIWLQIPLDKRPVLIMGGTFEETAASIALDGKKLCLRCRFNEKWLTNSLQRNSCSGVQYWNYKGTQEIIRTSGLASSIAANIMCEQYRECVVSNGDSINRAINYIPFPKISILNTEPVRRESCPDCKRFVPPSKIHVLAGNMLETTLGDVMAQITDTLNTEDYTLAFHTFEFANNGYNSIVVEDYCRKCKKKIQDIYLHESRMTEKNILCEDCKASYNEEMSEGDTDNTTITISGIQPNDKYAHIISDRTMYSLGWPLGGYIEVIQLENGFDAIDADYTKTIFTMSGDKDKVLTNIDLLNGR